jgi:hypothetical protein
MPAEGITEATRERETFKYVMPPVSFQLGPFATTISIPAVQEFV